jgi:hypothetical protein
MHEISEDALQCEFSQQTLHLDAKTFDLRKFREEIRLQWWSIFLSVFLENRRLFMW